MTATTIAQQTTLIAFSKITAPDELNARQKTKDGIDALADSIARFGLLQPLTVRPAPVLDGLQSSGTFEIIAGRRRYQALAKLVKDKVIPRSAQIPVVIRDEDNATALELSLVENNERLPMHPVDQHEVFARLVDQGRTEGEIAERFSITPRTVKQHLALAGMAPVIRQAWRKGKITREIAHAFADLADPDTQAETYNRLAKSRGALTEHLVRRELSNDRVFVEDCGLITFIGLEAYLAAGGKITDSLFAAERFLDDVPLARRLAREKLQSECDRLVADGWSFAEYSWRLEGIDGLQLWQTKSIDDERGDDLSAFTAEEKARSGVLVQVEYDGRSFEYAGGITKSTAQQNRDDDDDSEFDDNGNETGDDVNETGDVDNDDAFAVSQALTQSVTEALTVAAASALAGSPDLALRVALAALTCRYDSPAKISTHGHAVVSDLIEHVRIFDDRFAEVMALDSDTVSLAFARAVAGTFDLTSETWKFKARNSGVEEIRDALDGPTFLAAARNSFNVSDYFRRAHAATSLAAIDEIREAGFGAGLPPDDVLADAKKGELATLATKHAADCGWLPPQLRHPTYALAAAASQSEAAE